MEVNAQGPLIHIEQIRDDLTWRIRREAMYPNAALDEVKLDDDSEGMHFGLFAYGRLTTVISLFNEGTVYRFRKFATLPDAQGKGLGTAMLTYLIAHVREMKGTKLWCNARVSASVFYQKFGFKETDRRSRNRGLEFVIMELQLDNTIAT